MVGKQIVGETSKRSRNWKQYIIIIIFIKYFKFINFNFIINKNQFYSGETLTNSSIELIPVSSSGPEVIDYDLFSNFKNFDLKTFSPVIYSYSSPNEQDYKNYVIYLVHLHTFGA